MEDTYPLVGVHLMTGEQGVGIAIKQESLLTTLINDSDLDNLVALSTEIISAMVVTIVLQTPENIQTDFTERLKAEIADRCCGEDLMEKIVESKRNVVD